MIEAKTKYTKEALRKFQWFHLAQAGVSGKVFVISVIVMFFAGVLTILASFLAGSPSFWGLIFICLAAFFLLIPRINTCYACKKSPALFDTSIGYAFSEEHFTVTNTGSVINGVSEIKYEALFRACEARDFFYLYIQPSQAYIVDKKDFTGGTSEELSLLLAKALPAKKFRRYLKKKAKSA